MRNELPIYSDCRETGRDLIPNLPSGWHVKRLKFLMPKVTVGIVITPSKYYVDSGVPAIRSLNVKVGKIVYDDLVYFSAKDNEQLSKTQIHEGDIVLVRTGQTGASAVVESNCDGWNCIDLIIIRLSKRLDSRFLQYFLTSRVSEAQISMSSDGAIQQHFNIGLVKELLVVEPAQTTQRAIVSFLDVETGKIDRLMGVRRRQIEVLREQRAAVIHHAVTQGLDPTAPMKDSGIEWLEKIPAHWRMWRLKFLANITLGKMVTSKCPGSDYMLKPYLKARNIRWETVDVSDIDDMWFSEAEMKKLRLEKDDLLVSEGGEVGRSAIWSEIGLECYIQNSVNRVRMRVRMIARFYLYQLEACGTTGHFDAIVNRISIGHLTREKLADVAFAKPPRAEQQAIVAHIDRETEKTDALIGKYERELALLEEYRASLISHAVTGKIDVRGLVEGNEKEPWDGMKA